MMVVVWLGMAAGVVTSVGILWQKLVKPVIAWGMKLDRTMSYVEQQMHPNGGTSLRDSLNRIEQRLTFVEDFITKPK